MWMPLYPNTGLRLAMTRWQPNHTHPEQQVAISMKSAVNVWTSSVVHLTAQSKCCPKAGQIPCAGSQVLWTCRTACSKLLGRSLGQHKEAHWPSSTRSMLGWGKSWTDWHRSGRGEWEGRTEAGVCVWVKGGQTGWQIRPGEVGTSYADYN